MIYFILNSKNNTVKIGKTDNLQKRLSQLQTASDSCLVVILTLPGNIEKERELHVRFSDYRLNGEWFTFADEIKRYVNDNHCNDNNVINKPNLTDEEILFKKIEQEELLKLQKQSIRKQVRENLKRKQHIKYNCSEDIQDTVLSKAKQLLLNNDWFLLRDLQNDLKKENLCDQQVGEILKNNGYVRKIKRVNGSPARRWFKA
jgi:hypothetical protein